MAYLGRPASAEVSVTGSTDTFTGDGGVTFNLSRTVKENNPSLLEVFVSNVQQQPTVTYSVTANVLTFTTAPGVGEPIYVTYRDYPVAPLFTVPDGSITQAKLSGEVPVNKGGTGRSSLTANNVIIGNGTSAVDFVAPGNSGNVLVSDGTNWTSAISSGGLTNNILQSITSSSTTTIDVSSGNVIDLTLAADITTLDFTNLPVAGKPIQIVIVVRNAADGTAYSINWPASIYWDGSVSDDTLTPPTLEVGAHSVKVISLLTTDGGTKFRGWVEANLPGQLAGNALFAWGNGTQTKLGLGDDTVSRFSPVQVGVRTYWAQVSGGNDFSTAITNTGTLYTWGLGTEGRLGLGDTISRNSPTQVGTNTNWAQISAGTSMCAAITTDGKLFTWGYNASGRLGLGDSISRSSPVQVGALTNWAQVSATNMCAAVTTAGTLFTWGSGYLGKTGRSTQADASSPIQVGANTNWKQVSATQNICGAVTTAGTMFTWGDGYGGKLGHNNQLLRSSPVQVGALTNWDEIRCGNHCLARTTSNTLFSWGVNSDGGLGQGDSVWRSSPVQVGSNSDWAKIAQPGPVGGGMSAAITNSGNLYVWGNGGDGRLGLGDNSSRNSPVQLGSSNTWITVNFGVNHTLGIRSVTENNPA